MILRIEVQDMKPRYSHSRDQKKRITAYVKSVENTSGLHIAFCVKEHRIAEFTIKGGESVSKEIMKSVREYLQGEICSVSWERVDTDTYTIVLLCYVLQYIFIAWSKQEV